ncbi:hypothetical protein I3843_01G257200 [Carya illinoinensis]|nr:hypothetical protein I3843_01G257200 [Carya illinoinensis]KAG7998409.1 hypothetical protein I3843_01G257200 [Carya illinoinensis]
MALCSSIFFPPVLEEAIATCIEAIEPARAALTSQLRNTVINDLIEGLTKHDWFTKLDIADEPPPVRFSLREWINQAKEVQATVFIAVHGGIGEDGTLQALLEAEGFLIQLLSYKSTVLNGLYVLPVPIAHFFLSFFPIEGPRVIALKTCMDKVATSNSLYILILSCRGYM